MNETKARHIPLHQLQPWQTRFVCRDSDHFWDSITVLYSWKYFTPAIHFLSDTLKSAIVLRDLINDIVWVHQNYKRHGIQNQEVVHSMHYISIQKISEKIDLNVVNSSLFIKSKFFVFQNALEEYFLKELHCKWYKFYSYIRWLIKSIKSDIAVMVKTVPIVPNLSYTLSQYSYIHIPKSNAPFKHCEHTVWTYLAAPTILSQR